MTIRQYLLTLVLCLSWNQMANAGEMAHTDLASLCFLARDVVLADAVSHQSRMEKWNETTTYKIVKVYQGRLKIGQRVELYDDAYSVEFPGASPLVPKKRSVLFISPAEPREITAGKPKLKGLYDIAPSGQRLLVEDKVYRVEQHSNPGPYVPVPQGHDPFDVRGLERPNFTLRNIPISFTEFEKALDAALTLASQAKKLIALPSSPERTMALMKLLPAPRRFPEPMLYERRRGQYQDHLGLALQAAIFQPGNFESYIEAMGRDVAGDYKAFNLPERLGRESLQAFLEFLYSVARNEQRPTHQRDAALRMLGARSSLPTLAVANSGLQPKTICQDLSKLLSSQDQGVRISVMKVLRSSNLCEFDEAMTARFLDAAGKETAPLVLLQYGRALAGTSGEAAFWNQRSTSAHRDLLCMLLPGPASGLTSKALDVGFACAHRSTITEIEVLSATITAQNGSDQDADRIDVIWGSGTVGYREELRRFSFSRPLRKGSYQIEIRLGAQIGPKEGPSSLERKLNLSIEYP